MKIYDNIKDYFLNRFTEASDYSNCFYIRSIKEDEVNGEKADDIYLESHKRDFFEIAVLIRSRKSIQIGGRSFNNLDNGLAIVSPFQIINYGEKPNSNKDEGYIIYFKASIFESLSQSYEVLNEFPFFKIHTFPFYQLSKKDFAEILIVIEEIYRESRSSAIHSLEIVRSLLLIFLYKVKRITHNNVGMLSVNRFDTIMSKFEHEILFSNNNFLLVKDYASKLNISPIYLSECVKKATGKSAQKIIIDYKILHAKSLLQQMEKSVADVAYALGFNEVANFNQFFKRNTGSTATQFRKRELRK